MMRTNGLHGIDSVPDPGFNVHAANDQQDIIAETIIDAQTQ